LKIKIVVSFFANLDARGPLIECLKIFKEDKMIAKTIDEVIETLEEIIQSSKTEEKPLGYFAALYYKVTINVKNKLGKNYFEDDQRMEQLDVIFANRYLTAYKEQAENKSTTKSWKSAFKSSQNSNLIVLQHLLLGMNAHINLDLGIAAAEISTKSTISELHTDFNKINELLASLMNEVQNDLAKIWPMLFVIMKFLKKKDDLIANFSMNLARDGAWKFANELVNEKVENRADLISIRDDKIYNISKLITNQGVVTRMACKIIRWGEKGTPSDKIRILET